MRLASAVLLALLTIGVRPAVAQTIIWRPEERVLITSFNNVLALAYDGRQLYDVTENGLAIYDPLARHWSDPSTVEDGYPVFARPVSAQYSRADAGLWLRTADGAWYFRSDLNERWQLQALGPTRRDSGFGPETPPQNDVGWRVLSGTAGIDPSGRRWNISAVIPGDREGVYWAGTNGGGLLAADPRNLSRDWLPYGALARGAAALVADEAGVWIGGDGMGPRDGITHASADLQVFRWYESYNTRAPRGEVTRMLLVDGKLWAASADGVYVLEQGARSWKRIGERERLISDNVRALAVGPDGMWAGTRHGVALIDTATNTVTWSAMPDARIGGIAVLGSITFVASDRGLWLITRRDTAFDIVQPPAAATNPALRGPVESVATVDQHVFAIAGGTLYSSAGNAIRDAVLNAIGRPFDLRAEAGTLYVLGTRGVARWRIGTNAWSYLTAPGDIPAGPIYDVVVSGQYTWIASPAGALRVLWR